MVHKVEFEVKKEKKMLLEEKDIDIKLEKEVVEKLNCVLKKHLKRFGDACDLYLSVFNTDSKWSRLRVDGSCKLERRFWRSILDVIDGYASIAEGFIPESPWSKWYEPFKDLRSKSLEELAVKVDLIAEAQEENV